MSSPSPVCKRLIIHPNGTHEVRDTVFSDIYTAVGSDNIDWSAPGPVTYYCYGYANYERPRNPVATALYQMTHNTTDPLCGTVVVEGPPEDDEATDVPKWFIESFLTTRDTMGQEEIDRLAVPLAGIEQDEIRRKMEESKDKAWQAWQEGRAVDFGGILMGPEDAVARAAAAASGQSPYIVPGDGGHRAGGTDD